MSFRKYMYLEIYALLYTHLKWVQNKQILLYISNVMCLSWKWKIKLFFVIKYNLVSHWIDDYNKLMQAFV